MNPETLHPPTPEASSVERAVRKLKSGNTLAKPYEVKVDVAVPYREARTSCLLCESQNIRQIDVDYKGRQICECLGCQAKFMNPQYSAEYLKELYAQYTPITKNYEDQEQYTLDFANHARQIHRLESLGTRGRFLSIGCGLGADLTAARKAGWDALGFEVDEPLILHLESRGFKVLKSEEMSSSAQAQSFDCVYLNHVLEHVPEPVEVVKSIYRLLKPGGQVFIAVPNIESLSARTKNWLQKKGLRKDHKGRFYDCWHHLTYFSPKTLVALLERQGFVIKEVKNQDPIRSKESWKSRLASFMCEMLGIWRSAFYVIATRPSHEQDIQR